ncbi:MAG: mandelate racemase/muconate lactonizing enzyme family protein [Chloroflexi bacterium]|nr:mandelate racemase/muconate lactonizing enzyme family protein [Chloroflexota bacterium]
MKIESCVVQPVRVRYDETVSGTHLVVRVQTDAGIEGISFVSRLGGSNLQPLALLIANAAEQARDEDLMNAEAVYARLYRAGVGAPPSGLEVRAASAIECAAWDIRGKALGQPVWRLLGGFRQRLPVSANWGLQHGADRETLARRAHDLIQRGYRAIKFQVGFLDRDAALAHMRLMRDIVGPEVRIIVDANQRWTVKQAIAMGNALAEYNPYWIEDPVVAHDVQGLQQVKDALTVRICAGEVYQNIPQFRRLVEERATDQVMIDQDLGLTGFMHVAHLADAYGLPVVNHLASEILAHGMAAAPNGLIVGFYPWAQPLLKIPAHVEDGELCLTETPGLGLDLDEDAVRHFAIGAAS